MLRRTLLAILVFAVLTGILLAWGVEPAAPKELGEERVQLTEVGADGLVVELFWDRQVNGRQDPGEPRVEGMICTDAGTCVETVAGQAVVPAGTRTLTVSARDPWGTPFTHTTLGFPWRWDPATRIPVPAGAAVLQVPLVNGALGAPLPAAAIRVRDGERVAVQFGVRRGDRVHNGFDFYAAPGTPVYAPAPLKVLRRVEGTLLLNGQDTGRESHGLVLQVMGTGETLLFAHLDPAVSEGDRIPAGGLLGWVNDEVGRAGHPEANHLHVQRWGVPGFGRTPDRTFLAWWMRIGPVTAAPDGSIPYVPLAFLAPEVLQPTAAAGGPAVAAP